MALPYHRHPGEVLICTFDRVAVGAEMVKQRPVIFVSTKHRSGPRLCTVVPISTTPPHRIEAWHCPLPALVIPGWTASAIQ